ncbi:MAG: hypothetical protein Kow0069_14990 [Promethearchaeota archaeon]
MSIMALAYNLSDKIPGWVVVIGFCVALCAFFLARSSKSRRGDFPASTWKLELGFAAFFLSFAVTRVLFLFSDFERLANDESRLYQTYVLFGYLSSLVGIANLARLADTHLLSSRRRVLTWTSVGLVVVNSAFIVAAVTAGLEALHVPRLVVYGSTGLVFAFVMVIYGKLARQSSGVLRRNAWTTLAGAAVAVAGVLMDSDYLAQAGLIPIWVPAVVVLVGLSLFALGQRRV